jgi:hypothetical protein
MARTVATARRGGGTMGIRQQHRGAKRTPDAYEAMRRRRELRQRERAAEAVTMSATTPLFMPLPVVPVAVVVPLNCINNDSTDDEEESDDSDDDDDDDDDDGESDDSAGTSEEETTPPRTTRPRLPTNDDGCGVCHEPGCPVHMYSMPHCRCKFHASCLLDWALACVRRKVTFACPVCSAPYVCRERRGFGLSLGRATTVCAYGVCGVRPAAMG